LINNENFDKQNKIQEFRTEWLSQNPEIDHDLKLGDFSKIDDMLEDPVLVGDFFNALVAKVDPVQSYLDQAFKKMCKSDYTEAISLLNRALELNETKLEPVIYNLRASCQKSLSNYNEALNDINKSFLFIGQLKINSTNTNFATDFIYIYIILC